MRHPSFFLGKCQCGCGTDIALRTTSHAYLKRFEYQHSLRERSIHWNPKAEKHSMWKGGRNPNLDGYIEVYQPEHRFASRGYIYEHRLIWEREHDACLLPWADVHHKDEDTANNVWYNLHAMMHGKHSSLQHMR
jgi:hypothetical protein